MVFISVARQLREMERGTKITNPALNVPGRNPKITNAFVKTIGRSLITTNVLIGAKKTNGMIKTRNNALEMMQS